MSGSRRTIYSLAITALVMLLEVDAAVAMASLCGAQKDCVCVSWISGSSATVEVRCPADDLSRSGWSIGGAPPDGSRGSWNGSGSPKQPPDTLPGMPLSGATLTNVSAAKSAAVTKLRGEKVTDEGTPKGTWLPTACTDLFLNSPLGIPGAQLLSNYIVFRDGTGVKDSSGVDVCGTNTVAAWTTCCQHDPVVFICPRQP